MKNGEYQIIVSMIMLTCYSEKIFNPMRFTGMLFGIDIIEDLK